MTLTSIIVNDGLFHCSEVCAVAIIKIIDLIPDMDETSIVRTSDELAICGAFDALLINVGGVYNHSKFKYDPIGTSETACDLIYKHFGKQMIAKLATEDFKEKDISNLYSVMQDKIISKLSAEYDDDKLGLAGMIFNMNFTNKSFWKAVIFAEEALINAFITSINNHTSYIRDLPAVMNALESRDIPEVIVLDPRIHCERQLTTIDHDHVVKFIVSPNRDKTEWSVKTVDNNGIKLLTKTELETQCPDAAKRVKFIHERLFLIVTTDKDSAIEIATTNAHALRIASANARVFPTVISNAHALRNVTPNVEAVYVNESTVSEPEPESRDNITTTNYVWSVSKPIVYIGIGITIGVAIAMGMTRRR